MEKIDNPIRVQWIAGGFMIGILVMGIVSSVIVHNVMPQSRPKSFCDVSDGVYEITGVLPKDAVLIGQYQVNGDSVVFEYLHSFRKYKVYISRKLLK